jgi:hypothetical protein
MNRQEYLSLVTESEHDDWYFSDEYTATYNKDLSIRLICNSDINKPFEEDWAIEHPDKTNWRCDVMFYYNESVIYKLDLVAVDGGRARLPYPDLKTKSIPLFTYNLAKIPHPERLDEYIKRSGLSVDDSIDTEEKLNGHK